MVRVWDTATVTFSFEPSILSTQYPLNEYQILHLRWTIRVSGLLSRKGRLPPKNSVENPGVSVPNPKTGNQEPVSCFECALSIGTGEYSECVRATSERMEAIRAFSKLSSLGRSNPALDVTPLESLDCRQHAHGMHKTAICFNK